MRNLHTGSVTVFDQVHYIAYISDILGFYCELGTHSVDGLLDSVKMGTRIIIRSPFCHYNWAFTTWMDINHLKTIILGKDGPDLEAWHTKQDTINQEERNVIPIVSLESSGKDSSTIHTKTKARMLSPLSTGQRLKVENPVHPVYPVNISFHLLSKHIMEVSDYRSGNC